MECWSALWESEYVILERVSTASLVQWHTKLPKFLDLQMNTGPTCGQSSVVTR